MTESAFNSLVELIEDLSSNPDQMSRADMDEIFMLTNILRETLPLQFVKVVGVADSVFPIISSGKRELIDRLLRIISVAENNPDPSKPEITTSELLPTFELSKEDQKRVLELCGQMRKIVFASTVFDDPHKRRLLNRIAAIEAQINQKKGLFDIILGGVSDVGETLGKFGVDIEPLTKRMNEIAQITRKGTKEYEQLPAPDEVKKLPPPDQRADE